MDRDTYRSKYHFSPWISNKPRPMKGQRTGWKRHFLAKKTVLFQGHSRYLSVLCQPPLSAVHMPMLIPHRPRGRLQDYPCVIWERQNAVRPLLCERHSGWLQQTLQDSSILPLPVHSFTSADGDLAHQLNYSWISFLPKNNPQSLLSLGQNCESGVTLLMIQKASWEGMFLPLGGKKK